ncbi:hypothetical protein GCM10010531_08170 [Blastococcus jejuensis]|uniref:Uncharacterized protein n=1 Tax=Blastococcus jejuensis TaxID=351224 RepID=A0ABP6NXA2_9ACTN
MDLPMLAASALFSVTAAYGAVVGVREDVPGEPLGWRPPGKVSTHEIVGLGSGTMAPWPMPVAAVIAALRSHPGATLPAQVCLGIGSVCLVGTVVEPVTWGRRSASGATTVTTALHLLSGAALVLAGRRAIIQSRRLS